MTNLDDAIVAVSTPSGIGGIGIVRMSGEKVLSIADKMFRPRKGNVQPSSFSTHTVHYGFIIDGKGEVIDEVLVTVMRAPKTYTRQDIVEINCHGGYVALQSILRLAINLGARLAEPGEFTKRAFLNGRIDLTQAEAVLDIIQSKTKAFLKVSTNQLKGELTLELEAIREQVMKVYSEIEAIINFPEDDIDAAPLGQILLSLDEAQNRVKALLDSSEKGKILKDGIKIVICGKPNVGKSLLLNVLLKTPRAIVSDIAGTTRDAIEETAQIQGIPFQLVDTAGILEPRDLIEEEAVKRSRLYMQSADLVLFMLDANTGISKEDKNLVANIENQNVLVAVNKCDLKSRVEDKDINVLIPDKQMIRISALKEIAIDQLEKAIVDNVLHGQDINTHGILISNMRHVQSLKTCFEAVLKAVELINKGLSLEFVSEEIKMAISSLDAITGRDMDRDILDQIFANFCIGK